MEKSIVIETDHPISVINNNNSNNANNNKKFNWYLYVTDMPLKLLNSSQLLFSMYYWLFSDLSDIRWSFIRWLNIRFLFYKTLISMVDCHGEKTTKHFDQCGSHDDKNTLYFGGLG